MKKKRKTPSLNYPSHRPYPIHGRERRKRVIPNRINCYYIPISVMEATNKILQQAGYNEKECYVWWGGYFTSDGEAQVVTALYPEIVTEFGCVHLDIHALSSLHNQLRSQDQVLLAELHTHPPGAGGQNEVDASNPAVTYPGFISIIVPEFAFPRFYDLRNTYIYEYVDSNSWHRLNSTEIQNRFVIEESFLTVKV